MSLPLALAVSVPLAVSSALLPSEHFLLHRCLHWRAGQSWERGTRLSVPGLSSHTAGL